MSHQIAIAEIRSLCQRYSHPGVNPGTHALAYRIIGIIEKHEKLTADGTNTTPATSMDANGTKEKGRGEQ